MPLSSTARPFHLNATVSSSSPADPDDTEFVKSALHRLGHYKIPEMGITDMTDDAMYAGIRSFQKSHDLRSDGEMKPNGPTARKLSDELDKQQRTETPLGLGEGLVYGPFGTRIARRVAGGGGLDTLVGGSGSDTLVGGERNNPNKRYAAIPGLVDRGVAHFLADHSDRSDDAFREAARAAGLDPDRAMFMRDALRADKSQHDRLIQRGYDLYGSAIGSLLHGTLEKIGWTDDPKTQREQLDPYLKYARPRGRSEIAGSAAGLAILGGAVGGKSGGPKQPPIDLTRRANQILDEAASVLRLPKLVGHGSRKGQPFAKEFGDWWETEGSKLKEALAKDPNRKLGPSESFYWRSVEIFKKRGRRTKREIRTNGLKGADKEYYIWDYGGGGRHPAEIEVFDSGGRYKTTVNPIDFKEIEKSLEKQKKMKTIDLSLLDELPDNLT